MARRHKWFALRRFLGFQLSQLFFPFPVTYKFTERTYLIIGKGMAGATGNIYGGLHEFEEMCFLLHFLRETDAFVDVGANIGSYTVLASGHIGAKTIALEPVPSTFNRLIKNIAVNFLDHCVTPINIGAGSNSRAIKITSGLDTMNHVAIETENHNIVESKINTLDTILKDDSPVLIKIDVEGFETEVLSGAVHTLQKTSLRAIIIETNSSGKRYGYSKDDIHKKLTENQFNPFQYDPFKRVLIPLRNYHLGNTIYIRDIDFVNERIQNGESICIMNQLV